VVSGLALGDDVPMPPEEPGVGIDASGVETVPPEKDPVEFQVLNWPFLLLIIAIVAGTMATYMPREIRRMRIQSAQREYMDARLALAQGDYASALVGFDTAIEEAQMAYTRRQSVSGPAEWVLLPDEFYINLWRGRAMALQGIGRDRLAKATHKLADELAATVANGAPIK